MMGLIFYYIKPDRGINYKNDSKQNTRINVNLVRIPALISWDLIILFLMVILEAE